MRHAPLQRRLADHLPTCPNPPGVQEVFVGTRPIEDGWVIVVLRIDGCTTEEQAAWFGHVTASQPGGPGSKVVYSLTGARGGLRAELDAMLGDRRAVFDKMLADLGTLESKGVEAVATLYAVWNDMLIDGQAPTDDALINGVLNDWHEEKRDKFTRPDLVNYLGWMHRHDLTPSGRGPRTKSGALL